MSDAAGQKDRPGVGPSSTTEVVDGVPTNHYTHENPQTRRIEVVRGNPPGVPDAVLRRATLLTGFGRQCKSPNKGLGPELDAAGIRYF